jgi:chitodextrinase
LRAPGWRSGASAPFAWLILIATAAPIAAVEPPIVLTAPVTADATVAADTPTTNFGSAKTLSVDAKPTKHILLRFQVTGVGSSTVASAVLRLYATNGSPVGGSFFRALNDTWSEGSVTWQTAPAAEAVPVATLGVVSTKVWHSVDLSNLVTGDGTYSLRVTSSSTNGADYASREAALGLRPHVLVELAAPADSTPPSVDITNPADGSTVSQVVGVTADATDDVAVAHVEFLVDGVVRGVDDAPAFAFDWATGSESNGSHVLLARAVDEAGNVGTSAPVTVLVDNPVDTSPPTAPADLAASVLGPTAIRLSWTPSMDDVGVDHYAVFRDGIEVATPATPPVDDASLSPGTTYRYAVQAFDAAGNGSSLSNVVDVTTADPPSSFSFAAAGDHGANPQTAASLAALDASDPAFYLALGDLDYDETPSDEAWCDYVNAHLPTLGPGFPFELVVGNHEDDNGMDGFILNHAACLPDRLGATVGPSSSYGVEYYFDYPAGDPLVRVVMIAADHIVAGVNYDYTVGSTRYNWLSSTIDGARTSQIPWVVVGTHKPCLSASGGCSMGEDLMNLLITKRVDLVLTGHHHNYQRSKQVQLDPQTCPIVAATGYDPDCVQDDGADGMYAKGEGPIFVIAGSFGVSPSSIDANDVERPYFARTDGSSNGFVRYTVTPDQLDATFVGSSGGGFSDSFSIRAGGAPPDHSPPTVPSGLAATTVGTTRVDLTWNTSTDDVGVDHYDVFRDGIPVGSTPSNAFSDQTVTPGTTYLFAVRAVDRAGNMSVLSDPVTVTTPSGGFSLTFEPTGDAYVSEPSPTSNFGFGSKLSVDGSPREESLLKFTVSGVGSNAVISAKLRLYNVNGSSDGGHIFSVADTSWGEGTVTWNTAPPAGSAEIGSIGPVTAGTWYEVDLLSAITGDGVYAFRVKTGGSNGADYTSREGSAGFHPQLVVVVGT